MRAFIALEVAPAVKQAAGQVIGALKPTGADVKWVRPENLHLTLKFLGEVDLGLVPGIVAALKGACQGRPPLGLRLEGVGAFPKPSRPNVIWLGLAGAVDRAAELANAIERAVAPLGFEPEGRAFKPHLTIGRVRRGRGKKKIPAADTTELARALAGQPGPEPLEFTADTVSLIESTLKPTGALYTPVHQITLS